MNNVSKSGSGKEIGFWRGWSIAVGCAIGSGIFMMPTLLAPYGMLGLAGWLTAGAGTLLVALCLSRLVRRVPKIGGPYAYVQAGLGNFAGFLIAWTYWIAIDNRIFGTQPFSCSGIDMVHSGSKYSQYRKQWHIPGCHNISKNIALDIYYCVGLFQYAT